MSNRRMWNGYRSFAFLALLTSAAPSPQARAVPDPPIAEDPPIAKIRYISFVPGNAGTVVALRVTLSHLECGAGDGLVRWVGPPAEYNDQPSSLGTFMAAQLQCTPHFQDWGGIGLLHVTNSGVNTATPNEISPDSIYAVQAIEQGDDQGSEASYSGALVVFTTHSSDSVGQWDGTKWSAPDGVVSVHEFAAGWAVASADAVRSPGKVRISGSRFEPGVPQSSFSPFEYQPRPFSGLNYCPVSNLGACPGPTVAVCANGLVEPGEECDDLNTVGADGCSAVCLFEPDCGNGRLEPGESCDDGNTAPGDGCDASCRRESVCGNGLIELDEECDDSNAIAGDGCDVLCRSEIRTAHLAVVPLQADGNHLIAGNNLSLDRGGQLIWLDTRLWDWDPDHDASTQLAHFQVELDPKGMRPGLESGLLRPQVPCESSEEECDAILSVASYCLPVWGFCGASFRSENSLFSSVFAPSDSSTLAVRFGALTQGVNDGGTATGLATFVLEVPQSAVGTYTIDVRRGYNQTIFLDQNLMPIPLAAVEPATVQVPVANRFLPFAPSSTNVAGGEPLGVRVKILSMPQFPPAEGSVRWASAPASHADSIPNTTFFGSALQCDPVTHDWSGIDAVYLYGAEVIPGSTYEIRTATASCIALGEESCLSKAVTVITTPKWCDVAFPMGGVGQPNFGDISAVVGAFQGQLTSPGKVRAMVQPRVPNPASAVSFSDISAAVTAFQTGGVYPYSGPDACP